MKCRACSECSLRSGHLEGHDCDCADRWTWVEKAEAGRTAWEAMGAVEREELLLEVRFEAEPLPHPAAARAEARTDTTGEPQ